MGIYYVTKMSFQIVQAERDFQIRMLGQLGSQSEKDKIRCISYTLCEVEFQVD